MSSGLPKILIVDDEPDSVSLLVDFLADRYRLMVAMSGADGARKAERGMPDLILLDVAMPRLDGFGTCRILKSNPQTAPIPVIFLSAHSESRERIAGLSVGAVDFIGKPFTEQELLARIDVHIGIFRELRTLRQLYGDDQGPSSASEALEEPGSLLAEVRSFILNHLDTQLTLDQLAGHFRLSIRKLNADFKIRYGMSLAQFAFNTRMDAARRLLLQDELQVQQIADRLGYENAGDFTRAFRRKFGASPREYRKQASPEVGSITD